MVVPRQGRREVDVPVGMGPTESDEGGPPAEGNSARPLRDEGRPLAMLYVGLDLSRKRLDWQALLPDGERVGDRCRPARSRRAREARSATGRSTGAGRDRVDERRPLRARPARARRLGRADRRRAEGARDRAACLQDGHDRHLGAGRACPPRARPGDLAARPAGAGRARAGPLPAAPGQAPKLAQEPDPRDPLPARCSQHQQRPVRRPRPGAARAPLPARALGLDRRGQPQPDRHARRADQRLRTGAACDRRRPPLHAAARHVALGSAGCSPSRSPPRSARSPASRARASSSATPASARRSTSRENGIGAAPCARTGPTICAGR